MSVDGQRRMEYIPHTEIESYFWEIENGLDAQRVDYQQLLKACLSEKSLRKEN